MCVPCYKCRVKRFALLLSVDPHVSDETGGRVLSAALDTLGNGDTPHIPVSWNFPARILPYGPTERLQSRVKSGGDVIVPMGLTGAHPRLLLSDERDVEMQWSVTNRWASGVADLGFGTPELLLPESDDPFRPMERSEPDIDAPAVLGTAESDDGLWLTCSQDGSAALCPLIRLTDHIADPSNARLVARTVRRRLRGHAGSEPPLVVVRAVIGLPLTDLPVIVAGLAMLLRSGWTAAALRRGDLSTTYRAEQIDPGRPIAVPTWLASAESLRRRRKSLINTRRILEMHSDGSGTDGAAVRHRALEPVEREFVATMLGDAHLVGDTSLASFDGGRFCGFVGAGRELPAARLRTAGQLMTSLSDGVREDEAITCFSFETEISRGLRAETALAVPGGRLVFEHEYAYADGLDAVVFSLRIREDVVGAVDAAPDASTELHLVSLPVGNPGGLSLIGRYSDGSELLAPPDIADRLDAVSGTAIEIRWNGAPMTLVFLDRGGLPRVGSVSIIRGIDGEDGVRIALCGSVPIGRLAATGRGQLDWSDFEATGLLVPHAIDSVPVAKALERRLPTTVLRELYATGSKARARQEE